jgi:hyperosmotically inducible protein
MCTRFFVHLTLGSVLLTLGACDRKPEAVPASVNRAASSPAGAPEPDNTARNKLDRDTAAKTPMDQSQSSDDIKLTAVIRRAIMDDKTMSTNAKNCKIITAKGGSVTLRGPVESQIEKDAVEAKAKAVAGVRSVVNELEVKPN